MTMLMDSSPATITLTEEKRISLPAAVLGLAAADDGHTLAVACLDGGVYTIDFAAEHSTDAGRPQLLAKHDSYASGVGFVAASNRLVSAGYDGTLRWFDLASRQPLARVVAHRFWSWDMAVSPDGRLVASVSGQYLSGGYRYEPAAAEEPSVMVFNALTGEVRHAFHLTPPVLSVAISPDGRHLAAGNLLGDMRVWDLDSGSLAAAWNSPDFTSWGIVKSHHYVGGIFGLCFTVSDSNAAADLLVCGMGPMNDPMAGNGKQTWQRWAWQESSPRRVAQIAEAERGNGLMEAIAMHPSGRWFVMAGRLAQGKWNVAVFDSASCKLATSLDTKSRVTDIAFSPSGDRLYLASALGQGKRQDGKCPDFGRIDVYGGWPS